MHSIVLQLSAMDVSARTTMKSAAKCDKRCELQNSENQLTFERMLRFGDIPESLPASVSLSTVAIAVITLSICDWLGVRLCVSSF